MDILLVIILFINAYVIVYFRLNIKHYYEKENNLTESNIGAIFSVPPYSKLPKKGKTYVYRYWAAVLLMFVCVTILVSMRDNSTIKPLQPTSVEKTVN